MQFISVILIAMLGSISPVMAMGDEHHDHPKNGVVTEKTVRASGTVKSIAQNHETLRIFHDPIPELKWPAMNMQFEVIDHELTHSLAVGDRVNFEFVQKEGKNIIVKMAK
jgi:Cu/Ag efflux protein CusF